MLTRNQFEVLKHFANASDSFSESQIFPTQRELVKACGLSLGAVNQTIRLLVESGFLGNSIAPDSVDSRNLASAPVNGAQKLAITAAGLDALRPYKVDNAVIMAAGMSPRFAPLAYERPKGTLRVCGEVLIERQIRQLQEAGITDITIVVGYMKEEFFYLADEMGVSIVVNNEYRERNNNSTIKRVESILGNTYICSSDDWFEENPFEQYVYDSYYSGTFIEGPTAEWSMNVRGKDNRIVGIVQGGAEDSWIMLGHAYWSRNFSRKFSEVLNSVYDDPATADKLWEGIFADHINELPAMLMRPYGTGYVWEFDSLDELRAFDPDFICNVDSEILSNICQVLSCDRSDISDIVPIKKGMTNLSFRFEVKGASYVYRHPGWGSEEITNRHSETFSQKVASGLGIDKTFLYEDPDKGWKISYFVEETELFDYHNPEHVRQAMKIANALHSSGARSDFYFDIHEDTLKQIELLDERRRILFKDFAVMFDAVQELNKAVVEQGIEPVLSHNDFYDQNFLISADRMDLIDWEYSGMSDYASDIAVFICCCPDYSYEDSLEIFEMYFGRPMTEDELFHCVAYSAVVSFHWFVWALYKDVCGEPVGDFLYYYYRYTKMFSKKALEMKEGKLQ